MRVPNIGVLAPALLLIVALLDWSLVSLLFLAAFLVVQYNTPRQRGQSSRREDTLWISIMFLATTAIIAESGFYIAWLVNKEEWSTPRLWWAKFIGFARLNPWKETFFIYPLLATQLSVAFVAAVALHSNESDRAPSQESFCRKILSSILYYGSCLRINFNLLLPAAQLLVGVSHPSWVSLPFFICSCVGLLRWSLTSNHFGLFWWRPLLSYTAVDILLLYVYQLPVDFPSSVSMAADYIGLYKASKDMGWPEIIGGVSLLMYYIMLCSATNDLEEMELGRFPFTSTSAPRVRNGYIASSSNSNMTEQLLPSQLPISNINSRSVLTWKQVLMKGVVFQHIIVNFFTYGFPVFLLSIALWSFYYTSFCAFGLLMYTGYVLYAFPSKFYLRRLNAFLLGFILLWAVSTYMFNAAFTFSRKELEKDTEIWDTVGLWHYSTPGLFIFVQFSLGVLVAVDIFVSDSIFSSLKDEDSISCENQDSMEEQQDRKTLILVIATWCLRRSSRAISLFLIFILGMKPGLIHAIYMVFFLIYLLRSTVGRQTRQFLILLCEVHFALLYLIQLDLIYEVLEHNGQTMKLVLSQLGVSNHASPWEFLSIALLLCFSTIQNHGLEVLLSLDAILQRAPLPPLGFSIMKPQLSKWVLLTVCSSQNFKYNQQDNVSHVNWIAKYLSSIGKRFQTAYHSHGTYIAYLTILVTVYLVNPNYISFGYMFFLLLWVVGRQLVDKTRKRLWLPLMIYAMLVFIFTYILSSFPSLQTWLATKISVYPNLGFKTGASVLENIWESLAILVVMQLYRYERMQNPVQLSSEAVENFIQSDNGFFGFLRRFLIWHSGKILSVAVFYASIAPVSIFGFLYLITLVFATHLAKTSRFPAKLYSSYTGLLVTSEYLFQMWGNQAQMFPGQKHATIATWLGFQVFEKGFWGIESGLRSKALVIVACILQYNAFRWLKQLPNSLANTQMWEEPCHLFNSCQYSRHNDSQTPQEIQPLMEEPKQFYQESGFMDGDSGSIPSAKRKSASQSLPYRSCSLFSTDTAAGSRALNVDDGLSDHTSGRYSFYSFWGSTKESRRWNKNLLLSLKKERYEAQLRTLKLYLKFWAENFFNLFGLEINMLTLLLASFTVLNAISLFYVLVVGLCILLNRRMLHMLWPVCVFLFSCILLLEYVALGKGFPPWNQNEISKVHCHDCWKSSKIHFEYCTNCWLGVVADDQQMIVGYFVVFFIASFKLRADFSAGYLESHSYRQLCSLRIDRLVWKEISFETKGQWTWLDHLRLFLYRHFMNVVFILVLITGTLEYDILHLGYLGFALIFFRMRFTIMKKRNKVFRFLRLYNFILIVLSLAYQAPFFGDIERIKCSMPDCLYGVIGLYKYDYGFRITSRSALVDIIIFCLVGLQSYIFRSREFDQVLNYLEAEQIDAMLHAQEKRAAWKTAQLQHIREIEDRKQQRHLQVEKMKAEMSHLQNWVDELHSTGNYSGTLLAQEISDGERKNPRFDCFSPKSQKTSQLEDIPTDQNPVRLLQCVDSPCCYGSNDRNLDIARIRRNSQLPLVSCRTRFSPIWTGKSKGLNANHPKCVTDSSAFEITELEESAMNSNLRSESLKGLDIGKAKEPEPNPLASAVQLIGDGVAHVHSLGNQAVANIVSFFNIGHNESDSHELSYPDTGQYDMQDNGKGNGDSASGHLEQTFLIQPGGERVVCDGTSQYFRKLCQYCWSKMRSNVDLICYCCFVLVFLWNFSLLNMVYLAALFLYALFVNPGPNHIFWLAMLIYTELNILIQYIYQINTHHCGPKIDSHLQWEIGFPARNITSSFVTSVFPLFVVYFSTLVQCSIKARDGEWMSVSESGSLGKRMPYREDNITMHWKKKLSILALSILNSFKITARTLKRYWETLTHGSEAPPHFVQVSMNVNTWPEDGIQPERIESALNTLLLAAHKKCCKEKSLFAGHSVSRVRVESIESSPEDASIALAVFEVIYASPVMGCPASALYSTLTPAADVATELQKGKEEGLVEETGFPYPIISVIAGGKREVDLYAYIFFADLVTFFLVAIFYQSVIKHNNQFLDVYQLEDQFPKEFVFVLMILFFLIVLDRIIYLSSFALGKVIYYFFSLVLFTYSVTEYAWNIESRGQQTGGLALRAIYLTKAVSLALQALQIKFGLPQKSTLYGQFLTSRVTNLNYLGFHLYRALPFLYELRCVLDWSCTATSLTMYDWLKLEDIYASLFLVKCDINLSRTKHQLGQKQSKATKFCSGICLFLFLICVIWAPMLIYSSGNPTNIANPVKDVSTQIDIKTGGGRLTLYETTLCECHLWEDLLAAGYNLDPNLRTYDVKDIQLICCQADANTLWAVPPSALKSFMKSIDEETFIISTWEFTRDRPKGKEAVKYNLINPDHSSASGLVEVLNGTSDVVKMFGLYPRYFRVTGSGEVHMLEQVSEMVSGDLIMNRGASSWWSFYPNNISDLEGCGSLAGPIAIVVSEETPQGFIGDTLSKFSIWSLYITFVLAVGRFIRLQCSDLRMRIPYENFPSCDRLIAICEDIYAARAEGELKLEELLFGTLTNIYRSPHVLMEYTKRD